MEESVPERGGNAASDFPVRRIRVHDWTLYRDIRLKALRSDPLAFCTTLGEALAYDDAEWIERSRNHATSPTAGLWLAFHGSMPVGIAGIYEDKGTFNLFHMWIEPDYRGRHIGRKLVETATAWAKSGQPSVPIRLDVVTTQQDAIHLYSRCGFAPTGRVTDIPCDTKTGQCTAVARQMIEMVLIEKD